MEQLKITHKDKPSWVDSQLTYRDDDGRNWILNLGWNVYKGRGRPNRLEIIGALGTEITAEFLRELPLRQIKLLSQREFADAHPHRKPPKPIRTSSKKRSNAVDREHLQQIATRHEELLAEGVRNTGPQLADDFHLSQSTIRKRLMRCRNEGLLPKTERLSKPSRKREGP
jgi:hypothetical protein